MDVSSIEPLDVEKVAEENPQSRFRILNLAIRKPGVCFVCGSDGNDERQFVDFQKTVDWYGVVYICTYCAAEVAQLLGFVRFRDYQTETFKLQVKLEAVTAERNEMKEYVDASRLLLRNCRCGDSDSSDSVTYPVQVDVESDSEPEPNSGDADESSDVKESGDVSETSMDNDAESESEPEKPKRTRRGNSSS